MEKSAAVGSKRKPRPSSQRGSAKHGFADVFELPPLVPAPYEERRFVKVSGRIPGLKVPREPGPTVEEELRALYAHLGKPWHPTPRT